MQLSAALELNPILGREVRARWRKWPAFGIMFVYAALLALALLWRYAEFQRINNGWTVPDTSRLGSELFATLNIVQTLGWLLLAPVLTASSLAGEREKGTMLGLHLSRLTPWQIASGKLLSAFSFIALMLCAPLPIIALCFQLGGVSPLEMMAAGLMHTATAAISATIGLLCSARNYRSSAALGTSLLMVAAWAIMPSIVVFGVIWVVYAVQNPKAKAPLYLALAAAFLCGALPSSPLWGILLSSPLTMMSHARTDLTGMIVFTGFYSLATVLLLRMAADALLKPLSPPVSKRQGALPTPVTGQPLPWHIDSRGRPLPEPSAQNSTLAPYAPPIPLTMAAAAPVPRDWQRLPLVSRLNFENPVLQREVRTRLQVRQGSLGVFGDASLGGLIALALGFGFFALLAQANGADFRRAMWWMACYSWLLSSCVGAAIMGAAAFTREREQGMLQPMLLSLLTRREIIGGKISGALVVCGYYSLALVPLLLPCMVAVPGFGHNYGPYRGETDISLAQGLAAILVVSVAALFCAACGAFLSWFCRHTWIATGGTLALLFGLFVAFPGLAGGAGPAMNLWHPGIVLAKVLEPQRLNLAIVPGFVLLLSATSTALLAIVYGAMRSGAREENPQR